MSLPTYSRLSSLPSLGIASRHTPEGIAEFQAEIERVRPILLHPKRRPPDDERLFTALLLPAGPVVIPLPDGSQVLPVFSTPVRMGDYVRCHLSSERKLQYLGSSPTELVQMLQDLIHIGVEWFTLDRCPRCNTFVTLPNTEMKSTDAVLNHWAQVKATEKVRTDLFTEQALTSARAGRLEEARDTALESIAHVTMEDPRPHLIVGLVAVALKDTPLRREARTFLRMFGKEWEEELKQAERSGQIDFGSRSGRFDFGGRSDPQ